MRPATSIKRLAIAAALTGATIAVTPAMASAASTCTYEPNALPARVTIVDQSGSTRMRVVRSGQFISVADGSAAPTLCAGPTGLATVNNTDLIRVFGPGTTFGVDRYVVDESLALAPGKTPEPDGVSEIEVTVDTGVATNALEVDGDQFKPNTMRVASGGGIMLGSDSDVDIRDRDATFIELHGGPFGDFLSGRGGAPAASPAPSTTQVGFSGEGGNDTLVDGLSTGDGLFGGIGDDTLFTLDASFLDHNNGGSGFDQATRDFGDTASSDTEQDNIPIGRMILTPRTVKARAAKSTRVSLGWRHPKDWKRLRSLELRASDGGETVGRITIDPARRRVSGDGALRPVHADSKVSHHGKTVTAALAMRASTELAGRTLRLSVQATDVRGRRQVEPLAGTLTVKK